MAPSERRRSVEMMPTSLAPMGLRTLTCAVTGAASDKKASFFLT
jgi:hypothetical protein